MPKIKYRTFVCEQEDLQALLDLAGADGWRLHTCEPVATIGPQGSGVLQAFVVLDQLVPEEKDAAYIPASEGIPMKG